jgi:Co/Zn/Cd efflux system component
VAVVTLVVQAVALAADAVHQLAVAAVLLPAVVLSPTAVAAAAELVAFGFQILYRLKFLTRLTSRFRSRFLTLTV